MATLDTNGLGELILDLNGLAQTPSDVIDNMLMAGGEVIKKGHERELQSLGLVKTGRLKSSITIHKKRSGSSRYVLIYPYGSHHQYNKNRGGVATATNNDVGFVLEVGGHGIHPRQWMRVANEKNIDAAVDAEYKVYDLFLKTKGL